ncbi:3-keto-5-aminohexanoate cleavage protein [Rhodobacteraceae bacterium D3-12]|nr:3-keto-5-aminohexanoate cleavage protein [Rhodobacteraceae bacterium D3-12]
MTPEARFAAVEQLAKAGLLEWTVVDPGSTLFLSHEDAAQGVPGFLYDNPEGDIRQGLMLGQRHAFHPSYAIYEPGFVRAGAALAACYPGVPRPVYRFMFSDGFTFGYPPREYALESYLALLDELDSGAAWMVAGLQVDIRPLIGAAVARGGHVRVGLEDAPFGSAMSNMEWTETAVREIEAAGGALASTDEVRAMVR